MITRKYRATVLLGALLAAGCGQRQPQQDPDRFAALDAQGRVLDAPLNHRCVLDRRTGLVWEVKRDDGGLHSAGDTYTWYSNDDGVNMSEPGTHAGGRCVLARCDTEAFVEAVNAVGLCGANDWRMPAHEESLTLGVDRDAQHGHVLDPDYFPRTLAGEYWTATTFRLYPQGAWAWDTRNGLDRTDWKSEPKPVRLVRVPD